MNPKTKQPLVQGYRPTTGRWADTSKADKPTKTDKPADPKGKAEQLPTKPHPLA